MANDKFFEEMAKFLKKYHIRRGDLQSIIKIIKGRINECTQADIENESLCLICKQEMNQTIHSDLLQYLKSKFRIQTLSVILDKINQYGDYKVHNIKGMRISDIRRFSCIACSNSITEAIKKSRVDIPERERQKNIQEKISHEKYIKESKIIASNKNTHIRDRYSRLESLIRYKEWHEKNLETMSYKDFLKTEYWDIVRKYVLFKSKYKCELCLDNAKFHVHHKTYEHRGKEIFNIKDLIVLCETCHAKFHDQYTESKEG